MYVLNANSLAKQHALTQLTTDIVHYNADVAVLSETHLNERHSDSKMTISGFDLVRRDRVGRPGGGVAIYTARQVPLDSQQYKLILLVTTAER